MVSVGHWTGREARALRRALRLSVRSFAEHLGVATRTVAKWEALADATFPRPDNQAILDTALQRAGAEAAARFEMILARASGADEAAVTTTANGWHSPRHGDYETWADDLGRAAASLAQQDFAFASHLLDRWLRRINTDGIDEHGLYLHARSVSLLADIQRDQGMLSGPISARQTYRTAHRLFGELGVPRRAAQIELSLAVVDEMQGRLAPAAEQYDSLAADNRLSARDRIRAQSWIGTTLTKKGHNERALRHLEAAAQRFEDIEEPEDWSVTHQKLALASRGNGDLDRAQRYIEVALTHAPKQSPMQRVRLDTAHAHILLSDRATTDQGLAILTQAAESSDQHGLTHQRRSIDRIRNAFELAH